MPTSITWSDDHLNLELHVAGMVYYGNTIAPVVYTLDFANVYSRSCEASDMMAWKPSTQHTDQSEMQCVMGGEYSFTHRAPLSCCSVGTIENSKTPVPCACTPDDYSCSYGYTRVETGECIEDESFLQNKSNLCETQILESVLEYPPYQKKLGNICGDGKVGIVNATEVPCAKIVAEELATSPWIIAVSCLVAVLAASAIVVFAVLRYRKKQMQNRYERLPSIGVQTENFNFPIDADASFEDLAELEVDDDSAAKTNGKELGSYDSALNVQDDKARLGATQEIDLEGSDAI